MKSHETWDETSASPRPRRAVSHVAAGCVMAEGVSALRFKTRLFHFLMAPDMPRRSRKGLPLREKVKVINKERK